MQINIISEKENPLFNRKEIKLDVKASVTPSNAEVEKWIAEKYSVDAGQIKILGIYGRFGSQKFDVRANVYENAEDKEKTEIKTKKQRDAEKKARVEEMKKTAEEKPKIEEEKVEENKEEVKE